MKNQATIAGLDQSITERIRFACPECHGELETDAGAVLCPACRRRWPIIDGIPHFVQEFPYWGEVSLDNMHALNRRAASDRWDSGLKDSTDEEVRRAAEMILNLDRANWQWLLDLPADSRVLDIGAGMGTNSHALALRYREVVAVEPVRERIAFIRQRFRQEGLTNVQVVRGSVWTLPFPRNSFDLAVMNGVLEWVPGGQEGDPREAQLRALRSIHDLLKPGGYIYVGIENRLVPGYFYGYPDPHCGLPFVTVLPRPLAHWYAKRRGQNGYPNYLYSSRGYRKLLNEAGFETPELYVAVPSYNHPKFFIPLDRNIFRYYWENFNSGTKSVLKRLAQRILLATGIMEHLEYSYVVLARKAAR